MGFGDNDEVGDQPVDPIDDDARSDSGSKKKRPNRKRKFSTAEEDKAAVPPDWLIEDLIPMDADVALYASPQHLKSFLALDLGASIAMGCKALGLFEVKHPGPVFYFAGEGFTSMRKKRRVAWEIQHGYGPYSATGIKFGNGVLITTDDELVEEDIVEIEEVLDAEKSRLFIIDTKNRALNGQDEDKSHVAAKYLNCLQRVRERIGGSSLTIGHMGWDGERERGSSAFRGGFDTILWIDKMKRNLDTGEHVISLLIRKQKDDEDGQRYYMRAIKVQTPEGDSLVLEPMTKQDGLAAFAETKIQTSKTNPATVEAAMREIRPLGGTAGTREIAQKIAEMSDQKLNTVETYLSRNRGPGDKFEKYVFGDPREAKWCIPGQHLEGTEPGSWSAGVKNFGQDPGAGQAVIFN